jgi:hypothetical protein
MYIYMYIYIYIYIYIYVRCIGCRRTWGWGEGVWRRWRGACDVAGVLWVSIFTHISAGLSQRHAPTSTYAQTNTHTHTHTHTHVYSYTSTATLRGFAFVRGVTYV